MWRVTSDAAFGLNWSVFVNKGALLVYVTLYTSRVDSRRQARLFEFKPTVRIVAVAALHHSFQYLMMERQLELVFGLTVAAQAKLRFADLKQLHTRYAWLLSVCRREKDI